MARNAIIISKDDASLITSLYDKAKHAEVTFGPDQSASFRMYILNQSTRRDVCDAFERLKEKTLVANGSSEE